VEYLITTSFLLLVTGIIFAYALFIYTDSTDRSTANSAVSTIVNTIDQVLALGPENVLYTEVEIPKNVDSILTEDSSINSVTAFVIKLQTSSGITEISRTAKGLFTVDDTAKCMLQKQGRYTVRVAWLPPNGPKVCVDNGSGTCQTNCS
jgi:hypothetical protein